MLIDLADPMARHRNDTTQTDFPTPIGKDTPPQPQLQTTTIHVDANPTPQQPQQQHQQIIQVHHPQETSSDGQYVRGDEVDFVQTKQMPEQQMPVFEKILWPEKQRPHKFTVPQPHRAHVQHSNGGGGVVTPRNNFNNLPPRSVQQQQQFVNSSQQRAATYSQQNINAYKPPPPQPHYPPHHGGECRRMGHHLQCPSDADRPMAAIRPGFVANAARLWDSRARNTGDLNTIV